ncbi:hypothetical protein BGW80DRAFT_1168046 [Lactifluus volemus]|nr:hypothetical protein BGW80DRAFT_1168046 [Lactifluus volemus]
MCHFTPATYIVWSILSILLGIFLVYHLWCFDRFRCLRWNQGSQGTFKRVMTYAYLLSVPLLITYAVGFSVIKYSEGFIELPGFGIIPNPYELWTSAHRNAIIPLYFCVACAWGLEMVTHLEELCFWLFVVNLGPTQKDWFGSLYFRTWIVGSSIAVLYMPLVTILTRSDPLKCEVYTFLAGSLGSLCLTLWFLPVLYYFQPFLDGLRKEGVDMNTIIRLTKFHELNTIRTMLRLCFAIPIFILAVDGLRPHHHVNESMCVAPKFLSILAGFGIILSSAMTLIFFPRSIENEIAAHDVGIRSRIFTTRSHLALVSHEQELCGTYDVADTATDSKDARPSSLYPVPSSLPQSQMDIEPALPQRPSSLTPLPLPDSFPLSPNRYRSSLNSRTPPPTAKSLSENVDRFNNPATKVSLFRQSLRSPIGTYISHQTRTVSWHQSTSSADCVHRRSDIDLRGRPRW